MRGGDIVYDAEAELRCGRDTGSSDPPQPVELHLLERAWSNDARQAEEDPEALEHGIADLNDPARWTPIEREAFLKSYWESTESGRRRKYYQITDTGATALARKRREWGQFAAAVDRVLGKIAPAGDATPQIATAW